jgi:hypothetical protein
VDWIIFFSLTSFSQAFQGDGWCCGTCGIGQCLTLKYLMHVIVEGLLPAFGHVVGAQCCEAR